MENTEIERTLDRILITALFDFLDDEAKKSVLASVHEMIDRSTYDDRSTLDYPEQIERVELLREQLNQRLPESLCWSREDLLQNY
ncbi:TPA: hypothetical protein QCI16_003088 [Enterobacter ludwigii]|uniref:hypothetical protein n=1 Tax=Enterobacter sp. 200527-13 TaxID=2995131 RepID=UPI0022C3F20D|nr:hypothetical protein [Enterobacter sp. 200527-13]GLH24122.1 hypothetical protein ENT52713_15180 [Enterobacter sp. 200527-13]HDR2588942.1 hypothetical protein [Enterobacter ludwigii]HDR2598910.1 hypothetical protein [Enterobacter ludwigii]